MDSEDIEVLEYMARDKRVDATYNSDSGYYRVKNGSIYKRYDTLCSLDDCCGNCLQGVDLNKEKYGSDEYSDEF